MPGAPSDVLKARGGQRVRSRRVRRQEEIVGHGLVLNLSEQVAELSAVKVTL